MPVVTISDPAAILGGPVARGLVVAYQWAGLEPWPRGADDPVVTTSIVDGATSAPITLPATTIDYCIKWILSSRTGAEVVLFTTVPASGPVDLANLPTVDPLTFAPVDDDSVIATIQAQLLDGLRLERLTQAEYDALPTPDPDVLYVITP